MPYTLLIENSTTNTTDTAHSPSPVHYRTPHTRTHTHTHTNKRNETQRKRRSLSCRCLPIKGNGTSRTRPGQVIGEVRLFSFSVLFFALLCRLKADRRPLLKAPNPSEGFTCRLRDDRRHERFRIETKWKLHNNTIVSCYF